MRHFKLKDEFWRELAVLRLKAALGAEGVVSLLKLCSWAARFRPDGELTGLEELEIEAVAEWRGEALAFVDAACGNGCLEGGVRAPNGGYVAYYHPVWAADYLPTPDDNI